MPVNLQAQIYLVRIAPGKLADFLILAADPLADITNTEKISSVWHRGKKVTSPIESASK
jgi:imidazolonepropionase-like amidohydrolase